MFVKIRASFKNFLLIKYTLFINQIGVNTEASLQFINSILPFLLMPGVELIFFQLDFKECPL